MLLLCSCLCVELEVNQALVSGIWSSLRVKRKNEVSGGIAEGCVRLCVGSSMRAHGMVSACARSCARLHVISLSSWIDVLYMFAVIGHPRAHQER